MTFLTRNFRLIFLLECHTKTHVSILMHFLDTMAHLFFPEIETLRTESIKQKISYNKCHNGCSSPITYKELIYYLFTKI